MATSANTIHYSILKGEKEVGSFTQNVLCKRCNDVALKFVPAEEFEILPWGYDEEEELWEGTRVNLAEWLIKNPAEITHVEFSPGDRVKLTKKRGFAKILELGDRKFWREYQAQLDSGEIVSINQCDIIPTRK